jgi:hypothetical protein
MNALAIRDGWLAKGLLFCENRSNVTPVSGVQPNGKTAHCICHQQVPILLHADEAV